MSRYWPIVGAISDDDSWLPEPESVRGGGGPYIIPIVDGEHEGPIAWASTMEQAERICDALDNEARQNILMALDRIYRIAGWEEDDEMNAIVADLQQAERFLSGAERPT